MNRRTALTPWLSLAVWAALHVGCAGDPATSEPADVQTSPDQGAPSDVAAPDVPATPCNTILQEGCAEAQNCTFLSEAGAAECFPSGAKTYGEACGSLNDCALGTCSDLNGTGSFCYKFCKTEVHCTGEVADGAKALTGKCLELTGAKYRLCELDVEYDTCNLLAPACPTGKGCYFIGGEPQPVCLPAGTVAIDEACTSPGDCAPGGVCINKRCKKLCDQKAADPCGNFVPCADHYPPQSAGYCD